MCVYVCVAILTILQTFHDMNKLQNSITQFFCNRKLLHYTNVKKNTCWGKLKFSFLASIPTKCCNPMYFKTPPDISHHSVVCIYTFDMMPFKVYLKSEALNDQNDLNRGISAFWGRDRQYLQPQGTETWVNEVVKTCMHLLPYKSRKNYIYQLAAICICGTRNIHPRFGESSHSFIPILMF